MNPTPTIDIEPKVCNPPLIEEETSALIDTKFSVQVISPCTGTKKGEKT